MEKQEVHKTLRKRKRLDGGPVKNEVDRGAYRSGAARIRGDSKGLRGSGSTVPIRGKAKDVIERERRYAKKYHAIKFFDRQKIERRLKVIIKRLEKEKRQGSLDSSSSVTLDQSEDRIGLGEGGNLGIDLTVETNDQSVQNCSSVLTELEAEKKKLLDDLRYVRYFPRGKKYMSLFGGNDSETKSALMAEHRKFALSMASRSYRGSDDAILALVTKQDKAKVIDSTETETLEEQDHPIGSQRSKNPALVHSKKTSKKLAQSEDNFDDDDFFE